MATRTLLTHAAGTVGFCVCFFAAKHQHEDVLDDLHAVIERVRPAPTRNRRTGVPDGLRARTPSRWLRAHPWQGVVLIAVTGGLALALSQALGEGLPGTVRRALLVLGVFTGIEAAGICLGYVFFWRLLGLRRAD